MIVTTILGKEFIKKMNKEGGNMPKVKAHTRKIRVSNAGSRKRKGISYKYVKVKGHKKKY